MAGAFPNCRTNAAHFPLNASNCAMRTECALGNPARTANQSETFIRGHQHAMQNFLSPGPPMRAGFPNAHSVRAAQFRSERLSQAHGLTLFQNWVSMLP